MSSNGILSFSHSINLNNFISFPTAEGLSCCSVRGTTCWLSVKFSTASVIWVMFWCDPSVCYRMSAVVSALFRWWWAQKPKKRSIIHPADATLARVDVFVWEIHIGREKFMFDLIYRFCPTILLVVLQLLNPKSVRRPVRWLRVIKSRRNRAR